MPDWLVNARQYVSARVYREHESVETGLMLTANEIILSNANGIQVAPLQAVTKVNRDNGDVVISSNQQEFIRAPIDLDQETLGAFFAQAREVMVEAKKIAEQQAIRIEQEAKIAEQARIDQQAANEAQAALVAQEQHNLEERQKYGRTPGASVQPRLEELAARADQPITQGEPRTTSTFKPEPQQQPKQQNIQELWKTNKYLNSIDTLPENVTYDYASVMRRFGAVTLDNILFGILSGLVRTWLQGASPLIFLLILAAAYWAYYAYFESFYGATLGKMLLSIQVVNMENYRIGYGRATLRLVGRVIPMIAGYVVVLVLGANAASLVLGLAVVLGLNMTVFFSKHHQAAHDFAAGTVVIKRN
jgi:uncharacterized RDD family membrane protein YckC